MKPYPRYKPTGLAWLPSVPEHWEVVRGKQLFRPIDERSKTGSEQLLSVSERHGVVRRENANVTMFMAQSYEGYKLCWPDDLAINSLWAWSYGLGFSHDFGIISTAYSVFRLKDKEQAIPQFYDYFLRSSAFHWEMRVRSKGLWKSRYQLSDADFLSAPMILPPPDEQTRIVHYLDEKTAAIDELVRAKERQIELLRERKQALVSAAVTGRETSSASSALPSGWRRCRLKELVRFFKGLNITKADLLPEGAAVISYGQIHAKDNDGLSLKDAHLRFVSPSLADPSAMLQFGDVVFADTSEDESGIGNCVLNDRTDSVWAGYHTIVARFRDPSQARFLAALFQSDWWRDQLRRGANGVKVFSVTQRLLANTAVLLPPLPEQRRIVAHLDSVCADFAAAETAIRKQIALLQELRTRLVSDAVTGAVEV